MGNAPKTRSRSNRNRRARSPSSRRLATPKLGNFDHVYKLRQVADESDQPEPPRTPVTPTLGDLDKLYISPARSEASVFGGLKELRRNSVPDSPAVPGTLEHLRRSLVATIGTDPNPAVAELPPAGFRQRESNPCLSSSEDGSCVGLRDDASLAGAAVSGSSTTATTPEVSPLDNKEDQNDISDLECGAVLEANGGKFKPSIHPPSAKAALYVPLPPGVVIEQGRMRQISARYGLLPLFSELGQTRRRQIAQIVAGHRRSSAAEDIFLPWDMNGNYFPGLCPKGFYSTSTQTGWPNQHGVAFDPDFISRTDIQSLYSVQKDVQLKIIRAILDDTIDEDDLLRASVHTRGRATQPIHVFVDASNIIIGFIELLKKTRYIPEETRVKMPRFFYEGFTTAIERGRPCAKRILAGSTTPGARTPDYIVDAHKLGYETSILQRVKGSKMARENYNAQWPGGMFIPFYCGNGSREQGVDELLQLKMLQTLTDSSGPGTMIVATGDASPAEFSDGFYKNVIRALERGWLVEVVGFSANMSQAWFDDAFLDKWATQLRVFILDELVEELLENFHL